ncbi:uncharacterized protein LAESUDRAFT_718475 [Laetiporus sulphureus 93-53]|uniref:FAD-binding FR-type domain-containing protein n=1 Tax=Laetiporus sulphureus 93-53 TaxID=1314785 RepID=A0A165AXC5_9APHY|nr:uncharacterized protein LAESUDRAFT_718475 [Laetiporus sulphureus 93-53]KZS99835.1 hypothetical protein LAESUDRAFT_718475 [Laetiporus sulphureus 93-53]
MASRDSMMMAVLTAYLTTPYYVNDVDYITAYLDIHAQSTPSYVYTYILWAVIAVTLVLFAAFHLVSLRGGYFGALWSNMLLTRCSVNVSALTQYMPDYTIGKAWWTLGNRTGLIAFTLFPLIQLTIEQRSSTGKVLYTYAWDYINFIYGWIAFGFMTVLVVRSLRPIWWLYYKIFYFLYVMLVPLTLIFFTLHHASVGWWCWAALTLWIRERIWRSIWWLTTNDYLDRVLPSPAPKNSQKGPALNASALLESWEMEPMSSPHVLKKLYIPPSSPTTSKLSMDVHITCIPGKVTLGASGSYIPPLGFAHAELLPGRTIRLCLITPGYMPWLTMHPFTVATVCGQEAPMDEGRELIFLIRAKNGWTKRLWDTVVCTIALALACPCCSMCAYVSLAEMAHPLVGSEVNGGSPVSTSDMFTLFDWYMSSLRAAGERICDECQNDPRIFFSNDAAHTFNRHSLSSKPLFVWQDHVKTEEKSAHSGPISSADGEVDDIFDPHYHQGDYVEWKGDLGHEEHVLDLTNFEGDDDTVMPGERQFGNSVKREGRLCRAASQAALLSGKCKRHQDGDDEKDNGLDHVFNLSSVSGWSEAGSLMVLMSEVDIGKSGEHLRLELDEQELQDVGVIMEHAHPRKLRLYKVVAEEVQLIQKHIIVECCGPLSLNAVVRKAITSQINLE